MEEFGRRGGFGRSNFGGGGGRSRGGRRDDFEEKPVKVGEEYDVEIESVAEKGDGVTKIKGLVVFVPGTQKGEKLRIRIKELKRKCAIAEKVGAAAEGAAPEESAAEETTEDEVEEAHEEAAGEIPAVEENISEESESSEEESGEEEY